MASLIDAYKDPWVIYWYKNSSGEKISIERLNEQCKIVRNKAVLNGIPDEFYHIQIDGMYERKLGTALLPAEFSCDYSLGILNFNSEMEGETVTITSYKSRGIMFFPASRIWTKLNPDGQTIQETFQDFIDSIGTYQYLDEYNNSTSYSMNNMVLYKGSVYICTVTTSLGHLPTNISYWRVLAAGFSNKTVYDNLTQYYPRDIVYYDYAIYCCKQTPSVGTLPTNTTYWEEMFSIKQLMTDGEEEIANMQALETLVEGAEDLRVTAEQNRQSEESARVSAENTRVSSENTRISAENTRINSENTRVSSEDTRVSNESARVSSESTRASNETIRESNEVIRQQTINNFNHIGAYSAATTYQPKNIVTYNGSSYMCIIQSLNHLPTDTNYWKLIAQKGVDGTDLIFRREYDSGVNYIVSDLVTYNGSTYVCIQNTIGNAPTDTTYWDVFLRGGSAIVISETSPANPYSGLFWVDISM